MPGDPGGDGSIFDLFTIGIGPSSSHTVGPMRAARRFTETLESEGLLDRTARVRVEAFGSLALTGRGHGTDRAVLMGLEGESPEEIDPDSVGPRVESIRAGKRIALLGRREIPFREGDDLVFNRRDLLPLHSNGMRFTAWDGAGEVLAKRIYYSVGGGFVVNEGATGEDHLVADQTVLPHPFLTGEDLLSMSEETGLAIWELMLENEKAWRPEAEIRAGLLRIWAPCSAASSAAAGRRACCPAGSRCRGGPRPSTRS